MRANSRWLLLLFVLLTAANTAWAQEQRPAWLGLELQDVSKEEADKLGWETPRGARVTASSPGSPADKAGVKTGDIIVAVDRTQIDTASELNAAVEAKRPGRPGAARRAVGWTRAAHRCNGGRAPQGARR